MVYEKKSFSRDMIKNLHKISGLIGHFVVSWDQKRGMDPLRCTIDVISHGISSCVSSNTICSISTSLATLPSSLTPRLKNLYPKYESELWNVRLKIWAWNVLTSYGSQNWVDSP